MAWTAPRSWVQGELVTAAMLNEQLRDNLLALQTTPTSPPGIIHQFAGVAAPSGYLMCDGAEVSRSTYAALYAVIGITYGSGNGTTTFNLPDMRGRVPVGRGTHTDVDSLGEHEGVVVGSRRPRHAHTVTDPGHNHRSNRNRGSGPIDAFGDGVTYLNMEGPAAMMESTTTGITVGTSGVTDSPAYLVLNAIIKT